MPYPFDKPGVYAIHVAGRIDANWADCLGGLTVVEYQSLPEDAASLTRLEGWLPDQAALAGVLSTLYDNHYSLLYVEYLGSR